MSRNKEIASDMLFGSIASSVDAIATPLGSISAPILKAFFNRQNPLEQPKEINAFIAALETSLQREITSTNSDFYTNQFNLSETAKTLAIELLHQMNFNAHSFLIQHGEDSRIAANSLIENDTKILPSPCEDLLLNRVSILLTAWFAAMTSQRIVIEALAKHYRQEMLKNSTEQGKKLSDIAESVNELKQDLPEHFASVRADSDNNQQLLEEMHAVITNPNFNAQNNVFTKSLDNENTALHGQISEIERSIERGEIGVAMETLDSLYKKHSNEASSSEKFRLLAVTAKGHYAKGQMDEVNRLLREAIDACPEHKRAGENQAVLHLLSGELELAERLSSILLKDNPESLNAACILIQTRDSSDHEKLLESIPHNLIDHPRVKGTALWIMSSISDSGWELKAIDAWNECKFDEEHRYPLDQMYALAVIELASKFDLSVAFGSTIESVSREDLLSASNILVKTAEHSLSIRAININESVNNAATALRLLSTEDATTKAKALLDEAIEYLSDQNLLLQQRSVLALIEGDYQWIVDNVEVDTKNADLFTHRLQALVKLENYSDAAEAEKLITVDATDAMNWCFLYDIKYQIYSALNDRNAIAELFLDIDTAIKSHPDELRLQNLRCRLLREDGEEEKALNSFISSLTAFKERTIFSDRMQAAIEAEYFELHDVVVNLLWNRVSTEIETEPLRMLLLALLNSHEYAKCRMLMSSLSEELKVKPFYLLTLARISMRIGDSGRLKNTNLYLELEPGRAEMICQKLHCLQLEGDEQQVMEELEKLNLSSLTGQTLDKTRVLLAAIHHGDKRKGFDGIFQLLLENWNDSRLHQKYQTLAYTNSEISVYFSTSQTVQPMTAVTLKNTDGKEHEYFVWDSAPSIMSSNAVSEKSDTGQMLLGKKIGEHVEIGSGFSQTSASITDIRSVHLAILRRSEEEFRIRFPTIQGNFSVSISTEEEGLGEEFTKIIRQQSESTQRALDLYKTGNYPLALLAQALSCDLDEARMALLDNQIPFYCSHGVEGERALARRKIKLNQKQGCIADLLTATLIYRLDIWDEVVDVCGPIHLTQHDIDDLSIRVIEIAGYSDEPRRSVVYKDGQVFRSELSTNDLKNIRDKRMAELEFISKSVQVLNTEPTIEMSARLKGIDNYARHRIFDTIIAADRENLLLISEDRVYRYFAKGLTPSNSTWIQPVLEFSRSRGLMSGAKYSNIVSTLVDAQSMYVGIDATCLIELLRENNFAMTPQFTRLLENLASGEHCTSNFFAVLNGLQSGLINENLKAYKRLRILSEVFSVLLSRSCSDPLQVLNQILKGMGANEEICKHAYSWYQWRYMKF